MRPPGGRSPKRGPTPKPDQVLTRDKARLQSLSDKEAARAREEAQRPAAEDTAAAMEDAEKKIKRKTPPGGSSVDTL